MLYTPMAAFMIFGFWGLARKKPTWGLVVGLYLIVHTYVTFCWWAWWYGVSFGSRPMIDAYALLSIPLAVYVQRIQEKSTNWLRRISLASLVAVVVLNLYQTVAYSFSFIHYDSMSREAYFEVLQTFDYPRKESLDAPDYEAALEGRAERY